MDLSMASARVQKLLDETRVPEDDPRPSTFTADERDQLSLLTGLECPPEPRARQADAEALDIRTILRDGMVPMGGRVPVYGQTVDFGIDLIQAYEAAEAAKRAFEELPVDVRSRFASWQDFARAINDGQVEFVPVEPKAEDKPVTDS